MSVYEINIINDKKMAKYTDNYRLSGSAETYMATPTFKYLINIAAMCNSGSLSTEEGLPESRK